MTKPTHFFTKFSTVALVCICAILLAWVAPVIVLACDVLEFLPRDQDQSGSDLVEAPPEIDDASDDPIALVAGSRPRNHSVSYTLQPHTLLNRAWSPAELVRPPNPLNSI